MSDTEPSNPMLAAQKNMQGQLKARFYKSAKAVPISDCLAEVLLDGMKLKTPKKNNLVLPNMAAAERVAKEWDAQSETIDPSTMPMTRLFNVVLDSISENRDEIVNQIVSYSSSDLLCYRASGPDSLITLQMQHWNPILDWAHERLDVLLKCAEGIMYISQPEDSLKRVQELCSQENDFCLGALATLTNITGSAILALALRFGHLNADEAWRAAYLDEDWQFTQWGTDEEALQAREKKKADYLAAIDLFDLIEK